MKKLSFLTLVFLTVILGLSVVSYNVPFVQASPAWLSGWDQRVKLTVDKNDIDSDLLNFPVLIYLSTSSGREPDDVSFVFDELQSDDNRKKIAVTQSDGTTECKVEIEKWDDANEHAWLWFKAPSISSSADTDFYLYYDKDHVDNPNVGDPNSASAEAVWDSNFKLVTHMRDDPDTSHVRDSTTEDNDGTKKGANEPQVTTSGKIDDAQDFDGTDDYIACGTGVDPTSEVTFSCWIYVHTFLTNPRYISKIAAGAGQFIELLQAFNVNKTMFQVTDATAGAASIVGDTVLSVDTWYYIVGTYKNSEGKARVYVNGGIDGTSAVATNQLSTFTETLEIGRSTENRYGQEFDGLIDDVRISYIARTAVWIKATYETGRDHLLDFGSEETAGEEYERSASQGISIAISGPIITDTFYGSGYDGYITNQSETYNTAWVGTTGQVSDLAANGYIGQSFVTPSYYIKRTFFFFDTASLPDNATIISAVLSLYGQTDESDTDFNITIQSGMPIYPNRPLISGDYDKSHYSGDGGKFDTVNFITTGYNNITLNADGRSWINKTGYTKLCLRSDREISGTVPTGKEQIYCWFTEKPGTSQDPKLSITYQTITLFEATRTTTQGISIALSGARLFEITRGVAQGLGFSLVGSRVPNFIRGVTQAIGIGLVTSRLGEFFRGVTQAISTALSGDRLIEVTKQVDQGIGISILGNRLIDVSKSVTQAINTVLDGERLIEVTKSVSQAINVGFVTSRIGDFIRSATQSISFALETARVREVLRSASQSIGISIGGTRLSEFFRSVSQTIAFSLQGVGEKAGIYIRDVTLTITTALQSLRSAEVTRAVSQTISVVLETSGIPSFFRSVTQGISVVIDAVRAIDITRQVTQGIDFSLVGDSLIEVTRTVSQAINFVLDGDGWKIFEYDRAVNITLTFGHGVMGLFGDYVTKSFLLSVMAVGMVLLVMVGAIIFGVKKGRWF